jgi:hypothetical protein
VGQKLRLRNGKIVEVIVVRTARDVLRNMTEMEAILMGPKNSALYGVNWLDIYYEAEVRVPNTVAIAMVTPNDVEVILD